MLLGMTVVALATFAALFVNDKTPWGGMEFIESDQSAAPKAPDDASPEPQSQDSRH